MYYLKFRNFHFLFLIVFLISCHSVKAKDPIMVIPAEKAFILSGPELEVKFKNGAIVAMKNTKTGTVICDEKYSDTQIPRGLGHISDNIDSMRKIHFPFGLPFDGNSIPHNYHYPTQNSLFSFQKTPKGIIATWTGLENEGRRFPDETLTIEAEIDDNGNLSFKATATSGTGGVFGVVIPLLDINPEARFFLPNYGGMLYDKRDKIALRIFGDKAPIYEAPVMAGEIGNESFALWKEDDQFHPYFAFLNWNGKNFSFAFEHLNIMPFEHHKKINSVKWKLNVFEGTWMTAMTPYRNWYSKYFKNELKTRDAIKWADKIGVIIDIDKKSPKTLEKIKSILDPEAVLFHDWNARAPQFDTELPDWTPCKGYIEKVNLLHSYGFKTMAYVNTYCVCYNSPIFIKDRLREKVLTRKSAIWNYGNVSNNKITDLQIGDIQGTSQNDQFKNLKNGQLFYSDPLSAEWRKYHIEQMKWWNNTTGTDANYEDVAGCSGDFGNGIIDGKFGAQGTVAMMQGLLKKQPDVPMATEYGNDTIAFASKWALELPIWGDDAFKDEAMHKRYPINSFLFGNRVWISIHMQKTDFTKHVATASSDASGGIGMLAATDNYTDCEKGFIGHLKWRAQVFANRGLKPYFDPLLQEKNLICTYKDKNGGLYKYYDDGKIQKMTAPDKKELYARIKKTERLETELCIPDWPGYNGNLIFGLNPNKRYALFPKEKSKIPALKLAATLPVGIVIKRYYSDDEYALIVFDKIKNNIPEKAFITFELNQKFDYVCINGMTKKLEKNKTPGSPVTLEVKFPAYIVFYSEKTPIFNEGPDRENIRLKVRKISTSSGLTDIIQTKEIKDAKKVHPEKQIITFNGAGWEDSIDFFINVPSPDSSIYVYAKFKGKSYPDYPSAKIYINGKPVTTINSKKKNPEWERIAPKEKGTIQEFIRDDTCYKINIPIGKYFGNKILFTIASDTTQELRHQFWDFCGDSIDYSFPSLSEDKAQETTIEPISLKLK